LHSPRIRGSGGGIQRALRFAQHLLRYGWRPIVLTIDSRAYERVGHGAGNEPPAGVEVHRARGYDTARQLSVFGRYPARLALPDRWMSWKWWAVPSAIRIIRQQGVSAVWSTFPVATAHAIGLEVARRSGLPWIAEFRDPMWQGDYPPDPRVNQAWRDLERQVFGAASAVVVTTPGAVHEYEARFPAFPRERLRLVENGYDEETFTRAGAPAPGERPSGWAGGGPVTLLHSGIVYRSERDPSRLFAAIAALKARGAVSADDLHVLLRASGHEGEYRADLDRLGIGDIVQLEPAISYLDALQEMLSVDALLILQAANCNAQVPAKLYEYLRAERPILALTDPEGDTARTLEGAAAGMIARLDSQEEIEAALLVFLDQVRRGRWRRAGAEAVRRYSRELQTGEVARLLDEVYSDVGA
jgi:glycosyltransferase involved in cell wall biosynthesis